MSFSADDPCSQEAELSSILDEALVVLARNGDQAAFDELYRRYQDRLCRYITYLVADENIGCELTQELFLKAWAALPGIRQPSAFVGWLYTVAKNLAYNHQRREKNVHWLSWREYTKQESEHTTGPEELIEKKELLQIALAHVPLPYRACLILYHIEDLPQKQIALYLHMNEANVSKYVARGMEKLRQIYFRLLEEDGSNEERRRSQ